MGKINDSFERYIEQMYDGRDKISDERYLEEKRCYYTAYASYYEFFKHDIVNLPQNKAVFEIYMLEREFKQYLQEIADQIISITALVEKYEQK